MDDCNDLYCDLGALSLVDALEMYTLAVISSMHVAAVALVHGVGGVLAGAAALQSCGTTLLNVPVLE